MTTEVGVQLPADGSGKIVDAFTVTANALTQYRQVVVFGDSLVAANVGIVNSVGALAINNLPSADSNGLLVNRTWWAANTTPVTIKASAGKLYKLLVMNNTGGDVFLKLYNLASPSVGSSTPFMTIPIYAGVGTYPIPSQTGGLTEINFATLGLYFGTAITMSITTGALDTDNTATVANAVLVQAFYT